MARSAASGDETRERILQESLQLIARQGVAATPLRQIATRMGVSLAALYYYYPTKDQLLADVLAPYFRRIEEMLASARQLPNPAEYVLNQVLELTLTEPDRTRVIANDPAVRDNPEFGLLIQTLTRDIRVLLGASDAVPGSELLAQAALGVLTRAVLYVPGFAGEEARQYLLPAALRVLEPIRSSSGQSILPSAGSGATGSLSWDDQP